MPVTRKELGEMDGLRMFLNRCHPQARFGPIYKRAWASATTNKWNNYLYA